MFSVTSCPASGSPCNAGDPFSIVDSLFSDWLSARPTAPLASHARIDVTERGANYEVRAALPGAAHEGINVEIEGGRASINAKTNAQSEKKEGGKVLCSERRSESSSRDFELSQAVDASATGGRFEDGVLTPSLPEKDAPKNTRVEIR